MAQMDIEDANDLAEELQAKLTNADAVLQKQRELVRAWLCRRICIGVLSADLRGLRARTALSV